MKCPLLVSKLGKLLCRQKEIKTSWVFAALSSSCFNYKHRNLVFVHIQLELAKGVLFVQGQVPEAYKNL